MLLARFGVAAGFRIGKASSESIISILEKFAITKQRFRDAYNENHGGKTTAMG